MAETMAQMIERKRKELDLLKRRAETKAHHYIDQAEHRIRARVDQTLSGLGPRGGGTPLGRGQPRTLAPVAQKPVGAPQPARRSARPSILKDPIGWVGSTPHGRAEAAKAALLAGSAVGMARGAVHSVEDLARGALFVAQLNPYRPTNLLHERSAERRLINGVVAAAGKAGEYIADGVANPHRIARDVADQWHRSRVALDPSATPAKADFRDELDRTFRIGMNQGELALNVGSLAVGGPMAKAVARLSEVTKLSPAAKFASQYPDAADRLAELYDGIGHHFFPRRSGLPDWFLESEFNVLKPKISRGDFYELHYKVDPKMYGARLPNGSSPKGWSGRRQGLERYGLPGRIWHGAPRPLKIAATGLPLGFGGILDGQFYEDVQQ